MAKQKRPGSLPDRALPEPSDPLEEDILKICENHGIADQVGFSRSLISTLEAVRQVMLDQIHFELPSAQAEEFERHAANLRDAAVWIRRFDIFLQPKPIPWQIIEPEGLFPLQAAAAKHLKFVEVEGGLAVNPSSIMAQLIVALSRAFEDAGRGMKIKQGPRARRVPWILAANLANDYRDFIGREPGTGRTGPFRRFVDDVCAAIELDPDLIGSHVVSEAVKVTRIDRQIEKTF